MPTSRSDVAAARTSVVDTLGPAKVAAAQYLTHGNGVVAAKHTAWFQACGAYATALAAEAAGTGTHQDTVDKAADMAAKEQEYLDEVDAFEAAPASKSEADTNFQTGWDLYTTDVANCAARR